MVFPVLGQAAPLQGDLCADLLDDVGADRDGRGGGGRRCVAHVHHARRLGEQEVVDQGAVAHHGLGANARLVGQQVIHLQRRAVLAALLQVAALEQRVLHLRGAGTEVVPEGFPETGEARVLGDVAPVDRKLVVVLPAQAQYGVGADGDAAVDHPRQVHAEERQFRVGDRVDQVIDDLILAGGQAEVFAAKRNDLVIDLDPGHGRQAIGLQTGAGHQLPGLPHAVMAADGDLVGAFLDRGDGGLQADFAAGGFDHPGHGLAHLFVIDDPGGIEEQTAKTDDIRLAAAQLSGVQLFDLQAVLLRALMQGMHALDFQRRRGHQQLAADLELDLVFGAEVLGRLGTALAQVGFETARRVIDAGMDYAAVVAGLVPGEDVFLLQDQQRRAGLTLQQGHGGGEADDAAADDAVVVDHAGVTLNCVAESLLIRLSDKVFQIKAPASGACAAVSQSMLGSSIFKRWAEARRWASAQAAACWRSARAMAS